MSSNPGDLVDAKVTRRKLFNFFDIITIENPELIRRIETSDIIDRPHVEETENISFLLLWFLSASKFHSKSQDKWFLGFEPLKRPKSEEDGDSEYKKRASFIRDKLDEGFSNEDVKTILQLIKEGTDDEISKKGIEVVNNRWLKPGTEIPESIVKDTGTTLQKISQSLNPFKRHAGFKSTERVAKFAHDFKIPQGHVGDMNHSIHTAGQSFAPLMKEYMDVFKDESVKEFLIKKIPVPTVLRTAVKASRLEGILKEPLKDPMIPNKTLVIFDIGKAAKETKDDRFIFGAGVDRRQCTFKQFFYNFAESLSKEAESK